MMHEPKQLTPKQKQFVEVYLQTGNASEAARQAGYKGRANSVGPRLLANVGISSAIQERATKQDEEHIATSDEVLEGITHIARQGKDERNKLKAWELLGKRYRLFVERQEHSGPNGTPIEVETHDLDSLSTEELTQLRGLLSKSQKSSDD